MTQKQFGIIFAIILVIVVVAVGTAKFNNKPPVSSSPAPSSSDSLFSNQNQQVKQQRQVQQPPIDPNQPKKQIKQYNKLSGVYTPDELKNKEGVIETDKGKIVFELYPEATKAATNFIFLASDGFYDGLTFHRVEPRFVIQGGDPLRDGTGGPGYTFTEDKLIRQRYDKGVVAMAKKGNEPAGTGGSQFFIMLADNPLPPEYVIFGKVLTGQEVVDKIVVGDVMRKVSIQSIK